MSTPAAPAGVPYPWYERKKFADQRTLLGKVGTATTVLAWVATLICPPTALAWAWSTLGFRRYNDSWAKRGLLLLGFGSIGCAILVIAHTQVLDLVTTFAKSLGKEATSEPLPAYLRMILALAPIALTLHGVHALIASAHLEKDSELFLAPVRPTPGMRRRKKRNIAKLTAGASAAPKGMIRFGTVEKDPLPWRQGRYGMVVERPIKKMGHGALIGSNGMGKSKLAETMIHYLFPNDAAAIFIDFKADTATRDGIIQMGREAGVPVQILDIGFGSKDTTWYDLFAWNGTPSELASVLMDSFQFPEGAGGSQHYRNIAQSYLPLQIAAGKALPLQEGEGMFDFLLSTVNPNSLRQRIEPLKKSADPEHRKLFERVHNESLGINASDLQGLRSEITKIVNAAGPRLKANPTNPEPLSMRKTMDKGGVLYIGIEGNVDDVLIKVLGSYLFKELGVLIAERRRQDPDSLRDVIVIPDEASRMEERSELMNPLYTMSRSARVFLWPAFQSFASWAESTKHELVTNTRNYVVFDIPDAATAQIVSEALGYIPGLSVSSREETKKRHFRRQSIGTSGESHVNIGVRPYLRPGVELGNIPAYHAYIWFKDQPLVQSKWWWGKNRVRRSDVSADAALVKLIPYGPLLDGPVDDQGYEDAPAVEDGAVGGPIVLGQGERQAPAPMPEPVGELREDAGVPVDGFWVDPGPRPVEVGGQSGEDESPVIRARATGDEAPAAPSFTRRRAPGSAPAPTASPAPLPMPEPVPAEALGDGEDPWVDAAPVSEGAVEDAAPGATAVADTPPGDATEVARPDEGAADLEPLSWMPADTHDALTEEAPALADEAPEPPSEERPAASPQKPSKRTDGADGMIL